MSGTHTLIPSVCTLVLHLSSHPKNFSTFVNSIRRLCRLCLQKNTSNEDGLGVSRRPHAESVDPCISRATLPPAHWPVTFRPITPNASLCSLVMNLKSHLHLHLHLSHLSRHRCTEHLRPEEATLRSLDDLLVHALRRVVHDDSAGLVVDLGVDAGVTDEVDDPFLTFFLVKAETCGEIP